MQKRVLVTGRNGMLGTDVIAALSGIGFDVIGIGRADADIIDSDAIDSVFSSVNPDFVVHTAAMTAVDACEDAAETAMAVNGRAAGFVAAAAARHNAPIIHISTDYVFDGKKDSPYTEDDPICPLGIYGKSKALGESEVAAANPNHFILRTSWLYGRNGKNFVQTVLGLAAQKDELNVVSDQIGSPTYTVYLADAIAQIVERVFTAESPKYGIYHISNSGRCSWFDFAKSILNIAGFGHVIVRSITSDEVVRLFNYKAPRPSFSVLDNSKLLQIFGITLPDWESALNEYLADGLQ